MTISSLRRHVIPAVAWSPDSQEFERGILDLICNVIPVFGSHRAINKVKRLSACPGPDDDRRVTGTYVHRLSVDQSLDVMQPDYAESSPPFGPFKFGFQVVPPSLLHEDPPGSGFGWNQFYVALRGLSSDTATTILLVPQGSLVELFGLLSPPKQTWDAVNPLLLSLIYRISPGFTGTYSFTVEIGYTTPIGSTDPLDFVPFVPPATFTKSGNLAADASPFYVSQIISVPNANLPASPNFQRYAWRIQHNIPLASTTDVLYNPTEMFAPSGQVAQWKNQANSTVPANVLAAIQGVVANVYTPDVSTYAQSVKLWANQAIIAAISFRVELPNFTNMLGHKISFTWSVEGSISQFVQLIMHEGSPTSPNYRQIQVWGDLINNIGSGATSTPTLFAITDVNQALISQIQNWNNVWFTFTAGKPSSSALITTSLDVIPTGFHFSGLFEGLGTWDLVGAATEMAALSDASDASFVRSPLNGSPTAPGTLSFWAVLGHQVEPLNVPREAITSVKVVFRTHFIGPTPQSFTRLNVGIQDTSGHRWYSISQNIFHSSVPGGPFVDLNFQLNSQGINAITDWNNLIVGILVYSDSLGQIEVSKLYVDVVTAVGSEVRLHGFAYHGPKIGDDAAGAPIDIAWMRADGPAAVPAVAADSLLGYIGTVEHPDSPTQVGKIYEVSSPLFDPWADVSKPGGYFSNERDKSWSFTNYGELVIATNYADPVQVKGPQDLVFRDLIGFDSAGVAIPNYADPVLFGGVYPRARFAAAISGFLCLANCDPTSVTGVATPYTFWCSSAEDPAIFMILSIERKSSAFPLIATPGEITAMTGGEYGLIYKENSIWRVNYVGLPLVFDFKQVSMQQGTVQPRSIVRVDDDEYFVGIGGIFVIRSGTKLEPLIDGIHVRKFLFDSSFEEFSISPVLSALENENTSRVIGAYDPIAGCIFWAFLSKMSASDFFRCDCVLVYSPTEGKFSFMHGDMTTLYDGIHLPSISDYFSTNDLQIGGFLSLGNRAVSSETYLVKTVLPIVKVPPELSSFGNVEVYESFFRSGSIPSSSFPGCKVGDEIIVHQIRPIFITEPGKPSPLFRVWIEGNQSMAIGMGVIEDPVVLATGVVGTGEVRHADSSESHADGWLDIDPLSGEWFKIVTAFGESANPVIKEFMGWQLVYEIAGDH